MDSHQLRAVCRADSKMNCLCIGTYPCDKLPEKQNGFILCNQDKHTKPGSHWVCIFLLPNNRAEFFNSSGGAPTTQEIFDYLDGWDVLCSQKQVQSRIATTCGQHCIYFAFHRARGVPFQHIIDSYSTDMDSNDQMVCEFVSDNFDISTVPLDRDFLINQITKNQPISDQEGTRHCL